MKKFLLIAAVLVVLGVALSLYLRPTAQVSAAVKDRAVNLVPGSVTVRAEYQMELKSEIGGRVIKSELDPGLRVRKGDFLVQLDTGDLELEIERIETDYAARKKSLEIGSSTRLDLVTARENIAHLERMVESGNYPVAELEKQRRGLKAIEQRLALEEVGNAHELAVFENTLQAKRRQLEKMTVTAPFDGVVSEVRARPGDLIGGGAPIAILISTTRTVEGKISEENFAGVREGQDAQVRFLGYGEQQYRAKVTKILPTADPATQRYIVYLEVQIEPEKLVPGLTGEMTIVVGERDAEAIIPRRALFGNNVYVVENGRVRLRTVETGYISLTSVEILKGLKAGEQVIVDDLDRFRDGDRVRVAKASAQ